MTKNVDEILNELIAIDPSFADHEPQVRILIAQLLEKKPDTRLDEQFVARLRERLQGGTTPSPYSAFFGARYAFVGVLAILLVLPFGYLAVRGQSGSSGAALFAMNQQIEEIEGGAYGTLSGQEPGLGAGPETMSATRQGSPEMAPVPATADMAAKVSESAAYGGGADARMMLPVGPITVYKYVYTGDPLELTDTEGKVYSRTKSQVSSGQIASQLRKFNFGLVDLGAYSNARVRSFELVQDSPYGYSISVSFDEGNISINPNYPQWPSMNGKNAQQPLPAGSLPSESDLIAMANNFLDEHNVSRENYGDPVIQDFGQYRILAEGGTSDQSMPAPEQVTVTYPLKIAGTEVYEDGAYPYGLQVGISVRDKRVMSLYGLMSQTYTSSSYQLTTDTSKVLEILGKGGVHAWTPQPTDGVQIKNVEIEVGTPKKVLMHTFNTSGNDYHEIFVPALSFPVIKAPEGEEYYPKNIVIPLATDIINQQPGPVMYDMLR